MNEPKRYQYTITIRGEGGEFSFVPMTSEQTAYWRERGDEALAEHLVSGSGEDSTPAAFDLGIFHDVGDCASGIDLAVGAELMVEDRAGAVCFKRTVSEIDLGEVVWTHRSVIAPPEGAFFRTFERAEQEYELEMPEPFNPRLLQIGATETPMGSLLNCLRYAGGTVLPTGYHEKEIAPPEAEVFGGTSEENAKRTYTVTLGGNIIESLLAPVSANVSRHWLENGPDGLFRHTMFLSGEESDELSSSPGFLGEWRNMNAEYRFEGAELRNGWMEVADQEGEIVYAKSLESDEFHEHVDDVLEIDPSAVRVIDSDTFIGTICYSGQVEYEIATEEPFVPEHLFVHIVEMLPEAFVGKVFYGTEELTPSGTGRYDTQEARLNILADDREIISLVDSARLGDAT